jgi:hypothetical protein
MPQSNIRLWATFWGVAVGLVSAVTMLATVGVGLGFVAVWTCVPEHRMDPNWAGCSLFETRMRLAAVLALCFLPAWPAFALTKRWVLTRSSR